MHQIIIGYEEYRNWRNSLSKEGVTAAVLKNEIICERLESHLLMLDECYGSDRTEDDLGGFVAVITEDNSDVTEEVKRILHHYKLKENEYEYIDKYQVPELLLNVEFRLYLCSSDFAVELMIITEKKER